MHKRRLIIFVKAPRPGFVKTRLAKSIGPDEACAAYRRLAETLFDSLGTLPNVELRHAPDDAPEEIAPWLRPGWMLAPQGSGDLGDRLKNAFASAFNDGCDQVAIIGSDCPAVTPDDIQSTWEALIDNDLVLGPAHDGGYWLVALRDAYPELFSEIDWSTPRVLAQTLVAAKTSDLSVAQLRPLTDIDTLDEWRQFLDDQGDA